jgi:tetratricopeptide (TPR) repeat protein
VFSVCVLLVLAVGLVFGQAVSHGFVNYDDGLYVYENPALTRGLTAEGIVWALTTVDGNFWHPLTWISYLVDFQLYGLNPWGYHLTNILLHAANTILLFLVLRRMTGWLGLSALVAAVFAIHPLRVESVAWVAERKDVLSGLFFMLTLGAYVGYVRHPFSRVRYLAVVLLFALGLMAKPVLVTLPFGLLLLDYWPLGRMAGPASDEPTAKQGFSIPRRLVIEKIPLLLLSVVFCVVTPFAEGEAVMGLDVVPMSWRIANAPVCYVAYLTKLICPVGLAVPYLHLGSNMPAWKVASSLLLLLGISAAALASWRKFPYLFVGWFWYLGTLVPMIGLVQVGQHAMADRYTYLAQIGLYVALAWGAAQVVTSWPHRRWMCGIASALLLAVLMGCAWRQTCFWHDNETLWTHTLACTSPNYLAHRLLGTALVERREFDGAIAHQQAALQIQPHSASAHFGLANALAGLGKLDEAIVHYRKALALKPEYADAHYNLGVALVSCGQLDEAIVHFQNVLEIEPNRADAHNNLGMALAARGRFEEAIAHYRKALEIQPDYADAGYNLGLALAGCGHFDEALIHLRPALERRRDDAELHSALGDILAARGQFQEAVAHYHTALKIRPDDVSAEKNLAWLLATCPVAAIRNGDEALELAKRANQRCDGKRPDVLDTLAAAYAELGWFPEAVATENKALELAVQEHARSLADALRARLAGYQGGKPFRQMQRASAPTRQKP